MGFLTCMNSGSKSRERSSEKKNLDNGFRRGMLSVRFFVDSVDMESGGQLNTSVLGSRGRSSMDLRITEKMKV